MNIPALSCTLVGKVSLIYFLFNFLIFFNYSTFAKNNFDD